METIAINSMAPGTASVVLFDLDLSRDDLDACYSQLDASERQRAARFRQVRDRDRFVARRGRMREQLARDIGLAPRDLRIVEDDHGKPFSPDDPDLGFNLSHSNGLALLATIRGGPIGCDIEWRNPDLACPKVAERLFAADEYAALTALPAQQWIEGFYNCWTRKEAYVKALGLGLSYPLDSFSVSVAPAEAVRFASDQAGWTLTSFEPAPGFQAALVTSAGASPAR